MKEIEIKDNPAGLIIEINDIPQLCLIPQEELDLLVSGMEMQMREYFKKKRKFKNSNNNIDNQTNVR